MEGLTNLKIEDVEFYLNTSLERYTTIKLKALGTVAICKSEAGLKNLLSKLNELRLNYHLVGWGANQVLLNTQDTIFIKLDFSYDRKVFDNGEKSFHLPASFPLNILTSVAIKKGFKGWEVFTGIPASLGGAICMNAGTSLGEIGTYINKVRILGIDGNIYEYKCDENSFSYRKNNFLKKGEVILSAEIFYDEIDLSISNKIKEYLEYRKRTQPLTTKNCGSVFKNNEFLRAGVTIDSIGLKKFGNKNVLVSYKHANFVENNEEGTSEDFLEVILRLQKEIERYTGVKFEFEVKVY